MSKKVLIIDDDISMCEMLNADLAMRGYQPEWCSTSEKAMILAKEKDFDVILTDLKIPKMDGIEFCRRILSIRPGIPVIVMTAFGSLETAIEAIRAGAFDFITKPMEMDILAIALNRAIKHHNLQDQIKKLKEVVAQSQKADEIIGSSPAIEGLFNRLNQIADSDISVLVNGESGTGKELVARALHKQSLRKDGPFISVNCAAIPESLIESELFGHVKGAFTSAVSSHKGIFAQAEGGTIFLDEVGELPLSLQPKLLRALDEHKVRPIGAEKETSLDIRLIAATNIDLENAVKEGLFRMDLFFRINVMNINLPPLRARGNDILLLAQHFIEIFAKQYNKKVSSYSESVAKTLLGYDWPGNIRQLKNVIERAVALTGYDKLLPEDLPESLRTFNKPLSHFESNEFMSLPSLETLNDLYIQHVLEVAGGNRTKAAFILGVDRKTLYRKINKNEVNENITQN